MSNKPKKNSKGYRKNTVERITLIELPEEKKQESGRWVEYAVNRDLMGYNIVGTPLSICIDSPRRLGLFGGVQFKGQVAKKKWYMLLYAEIDKDGYISHCNCREDVRMSPAIPVRARFWVEE